MKYRRLGVNERPLNGDETRHRTALGAEWRTITPRSEHYQNPVFEYRRPLAAKPEQTGVTLGACKVSRVIDGDTIEVEVTRRIRVRLLDCWAPESHRTKHAVEKPLGIKAKAALEHMAPVGSECVLHIPTDGDIDAGDGLTFGRVLGRVWLDSDMSLSEQMRVAGYTYPTKAELEAFLTAEGQRQAEQQFESL